MNQHQLTIREATDADAEAVRQFVFPIMEEFGLGLAPEGADADLYAVGAHYAACGGWLELVCDGGELIGTVGMVPLGEGVIELRKMYLRPDQRGRGLGKALLARSIGRAIDEGFREITLETATVLEAAIGLYQRFGFQKDAAVKPGCGKKACDQVWRLTLADYRPVPTDVAIFTG